jgi:hypothetical protein
MLVAHGGSRQRHGSASLSAGVAGRPWRFIQDENGARKQLRAGFEIAARFRPRQRSTGEDRFAFVRREINQVGIVRSGRISSRR